MKVKEEEGAIHVLIVSHEPGGVGGFAHAPENMPVCAVVAAIPSTRKCPIEQ